MSPFGPVSPNDPADKQQKFDPQESSWRPEVLRRVETLELHTPLASMPNISDAAKKFIALGLSTDPKYFLME